jgi:hypothetical protein
MQNDSFPETRNPLDCSSDNDASSDMKLSRGFWFVYSDSRLNQFEAAYTDPPQTGIDDGETIDIAEYACHSELFYMTVD